MKGYVNLFFTAGANILFSIAVACVALMFVSCRKDVAGLEQEEPCRALQSISISIDCSLDGIQTKGGVEDEAIENVNLYIVNELGDLAAYGYYVGKELSIDVDIMENMKYTLYAIANAGKKIYANSASAIEALVYKPADEFIYTPDKAVIMSGKSKPVILKDGQSVTIELKRCIAKVQLKADFENLYENVKIDIESVQLKNIPTGITLFKNSRIYGPDDVADGAIVNNPTLEELVQGITFYQYENMQGDLNPGNSDQKQKVWPEGSVYSKICSYIELKGSYESDYKRGDIAYRFYLGTDMVSNYDVIRNTRHKITINFNGNGAVDENSWRVDNSDIMDLVTDVIVMPENLKLYVTEKQKLEAMVKPETAHIKEVEWSCSDESIASVDAFGNISALSEGECTIMAESTDGTAKKGFCNVVVINPQIEFAIENSVMYDGEERFLKYARLVPATAGVDVVSSNEDVLQILESDNMGVKVRAITEGEATITATIRGTDISADYPITVEKLRIVPAVDEFVVYNHFNYDVAYAIYPKHAAEMEIFLESENLGKENNIIPVDGFTARVCGNMASENSFTLKIAIKERPDVFAHMHFMVKEPSMANRIQTRVNYGGEDGVVKDLSLAIAPHSQLNYTLVPHPTESSLNGDVDGSIKIDLENSRVIFPNPNGANGKFDLIVTCIADDNVNLTFPCTIEVYETIYLVGISKTQTSEKIRVGRYVYYNEIIGEWLAHPNSLFYPNGIIWGLDIPYIYGGVEYVERNTGVIVEKEVEFIKGREYDLALDEGIFVYDGEYYPHYYHEYFHLTPKQNNPYYMDGESKRHFYIYSRNFMSGFSNDVSPDWRKVFGYVYGIDLIQ